MQGEPQRGSSIRINSTNAKKGESAGADSMRVDKDCPDTSGGRLELEETYAQTI